MLESVLNQELETLTLSNDEIEQLREAMAAGVGCRSNSCAGSCSGISATCL